MLFQKNVDRRDNKDKKCFIKPLYSDKGSIRPLIFFKWITFLLLVFTISSTCLYSIPKEIEEALKLNRINHFEEALQVIERALKEEKIKPDFTSAYTVGRILYRKGELYREMAEINVLTSLGYLNQVIEKESNPPDEVKLFLGISYFFNKQYLECADILNQVTSSRKIKGELMSVSMVYLGASYYQTGEKGRANDLWSKVEKNHLFARSVLGYMYAHLGINPNQGEEFTREVLERTGKESPYYHSIRMNHAYTLLVLGRFHQAYEEISGIELDRPIYIFRPSTHKEMRLYDLSMLNSYSKIILGESIKNLEPIATSSSGELASFASYYVAQMYMYLGDLDKSLKYALKAKKLSVISSLTMIRASALEASVYLLEGKSKKGLKLLMEEVERIYGQPSSLLELMNVVILSGIEYKIVREVVDNVESYIYEVEWSRTRRDSALLGELAYFTRRYVRALYYLERARDKGNKNKIETNDPTYLLKLSYVYYMREYFSESLEILFSLGKHFNGVRPLQDAVQSVYSYKQKGAGEALIE